MSRADEIDLTHLIPEPFWMLARCKGSTDLSVAEREEAAKLNVTQVDDFNCGLCYKKKEDADLVAVAMTKRFRMLFKVVGAEGHAFDFIMIAAMCSQLL